VFFHNNGGDLSTGTDIQRKLFYIKSMVNDQQTYAMVLLAQTFGSPNVGVLRIDMPIGDGNARAYYSSASVNWDTWYSVELEVQESDPGVANGLIRVWLNGKQALTKTRILTRTAGLTQAPTEIAVGDQADRIGSIKIDELRYWDDVVISDSYIGP
jgi:hypothetical protein